MGDLPQLTREEIVKLRKDLVGTEFEYKIDEMAKGDMPIYDTGNFSMLFPLEGTGGFSRSISEKGLAKNVIIASIGLIDFSEYGHDYFQYRESRNNDEELQKKEFELYQKVASEFNTPYIHLLSSSR